MGTITTDAITIVLALALTCAFTAMLMGAWHLKKTKYLHDSLDKKHARIDHLEHTLTDMRKTTFDLHDRIGEVMQESRQYKAELDKVMSIITEPAKEIINDTVPAKPDSVNGVRPCCWFNHCNSDPNLAGATPPCGKCQGCAMQR